MKVTALRSKHFDEVLSIENQCFSSPWEANDFVHALSNNKIYANVVLDENNSVVGYYLIRKFKSGIEILNLAIRKDQQRNGHGKKLIASLLEKSAKIKLRISEKNLAGHLFFKSCGFIAKAVERKHYGPDEDAYLFESV